MAETSPHEIKVLITAGLVDPVFMGVDQAQKNAENKIRRILSTPALTSYSTAAAFDAGAYLQRYPDVAAAGIHPVLHYFRHGRHEGRDHFPVFGHLLGRLTPSPGKVWIETHDLSRTGAPTALASLLRGWSGLRKRARVGSPITGPMLPQFSQLVGPPVLHGLTARRVSEAADADALVTDCAKLLSRVQAPGLLANSFLSWPMVLAAAQLGLPTAWIVHEPDMDEMSVLFPPDLFQRLLDQMRQADRLIFVSAESRKAWGGGKTALTIEKALPGSLGNRAEGRAFAGCDDDDVLILSVGSASPRKGQADLVEALIGMAGTPLARRIVATLVGDNGSPYAQTLRDKVHALRRHGMRVSFLPETRKPADRNVVENLFAAGDIFVMNSRAESLPLVTAEALAAGCPVISTDPPGIAEMISDGETGLLYPPGQIDVLQRHLQHLAGSGAERDRMRRAIAARADPAAYDRMIARYQDALAPLFHIDAS